MGSPLFLKDLLTGHEPCSRQCELADLSRAGDVRRFTTAATKDGSWRASLHQTFLMDHQGLLDTFLMRPATDLINQQIDPMSGYEREYKRTSFADRSDLLS